MNSRGLRQEPWWIVTFTLDSSHRSQPSHTLLLAFSYMLCIGVPATLQHWACEEPIRLHVLGNDRMPFPDKQRPCALSCWWHGIFLVYDVQWICRQWYFVQAWSQTACYQCTLVSLGSSLPSSLEIVMAWTRILRLRWFPCSSETPLSL